MLPFPVYPPGRKHPALNFYVETHRSPHPSWCFTPPMPFANTALPFCNAHLMAPRLVDSLLPWRLSSLLSHLSNSGKSTVTPGRDTFIIVFGSVKVFQRTLLSYGCLSTGAWTRGMGLKRNEESSFWSQEGHQNLNW